MKRIKITVQGPSYDTQDVVDKIYRKLKEFGHTVAITQPGPEIEELVKTHDYTIVEVAE
jgi:hypothetical protein